MRKKPRVLVCCEFSGIVRQAFASRGWDAWSVDLLPSELPGNHIVGNAKRPLLLDQWDLLVAHPPCQYLANSGVRWLYKNGKIDPERWNEVQKAAKFFYSFWSSTIPFIAVENPVMHGHAKKLIFGPEDSKPQDVVQPWWFGHTSVKATCFWTKNLPRLVPTNNVREETMALPYGERALVHYASPGPDRWKERSRTLPGLAGALAAQWGEFVKLQLKNT